MIDSTLLPHNFFQSLTLLMENEFDPTQCPQVEPGPQHQWLHQLLGEWKFTHKCDMGNDQPVTETAGEMRVRSLGGLWVLLDCESGSENDPGGKWSSLFTLGYDPAKEKYVGTFVASMMTNLWIYEGDIDNETGRLVFEVEGPRMDGKEGTASYRDSYEIVSENEWVLRSAIQLDDGSWHQFMEGKHTRP